MSVRSPGLAATKARSRSGGARSASHGCGSAGGTAMRSRPRGRRRNSPSGSCPSRCRAFATRSGPGLRRGRRPVAASSAMPRASVGRAAFAGKTPLVLRPSPCTTKPRSAPAPHWSRLLPSPPPAGRSPATRKAPTRRSRNRRAKRRAVRPIAPTPQTTSSEPGDPPGRLQRGSGSRSGQNQGHAFATGRVSASVGVRASQALIEKQRAELRNGSEARAPETCAPRLTVRDQPACSPVHRRVADRGRQRTIPRPSSSR